MSALTWVYIVIEVVSALGLIFPILMHSGKGGGLSEVRWVCGGGRAKVDGG